MKMFRVWQYVLSRQYIKTGTHQTKNEKCSHIFNLRMTNKLIWHAVVNGIMSTTINWKRALILFIQTLAFHKSFTYLLTSFGCICYYFCPLSDLYCSFHHYYDTLPPRSHSVNNDNNNNNSLSSVYSMLRLSRSETSCQHDRDETRSSAIVSLQTSSLPTSTRTRHSTDMQSFRSHTSWSSLLHCHWFQTDSRLTRLWGSMQSGSMTTW